MFHLFASEWADGNGGMNDYVGSFETVEEAKRVVNDQRRYDWAQIAVTTEKGLQVHSTAQVVTKKRKIDSSWLDDSIKADGTVIPYAEIFDGYKWTDHENTLA